MTAPKKITKIKRIENVPQILRILYKVHYLRNTPSDSWIVEVLKVKTSCTTFYSELDVGMKGSMLIRHLSMSDRYVIEIFRENKDENVH